MMIDVCILTAFSERIRLTASVFYDTTHQDKQSFSCIYNLTVLERGKKSNYLKLQWFLIQAILNLSKMLTVDISELFI